jgi:hypothetical protein
MEDIKTAREWSGNFSRLVMPFLEGTGPRPANPFGVLSSEREKARRAALEGFRKVVVRTFGKGPLPRELEFYENGALSSLWFETKMNSLRGFVDGTITQVSGRKGGMKGPTVRAQKPVTDAQITAAVRFEQGEAERWLEGLQALLKEVYKMNLEMKCPIAT